MKLFAALLVIISAQGAFALGISDFSKVQGDLDALKAQGLVCVLRVADGQDTRSGQIVENVLCGANEDSATQLTARVTVAISNPGSRCEDHTAIAFEKAQQN